MRKRGDTGDWSPSRAATAAAWLIDDGQVEICPCSLFIAAMSPADPTA